MKIALGILFGILLVAFIIKLVYGLCVESQYSELFIVDRENKAILCSANLLLAYLSLITYNKDYCDYDIQIVKNCHSSMHFHWEVVLASILKRVEEWEETDEKQLYIPVYCNSIGIFDKNIITAIDIEEEV